MHGVSTDNGRKVTQPCIQNTNCSKRHFCCLRFQWSLIVFDLKSQNKPQVRYPALIIHCFHTNRVMLIVFPLSLGCDTSACITLERYNYVYMRMANHFVYTCACNYKEPHADVKRALGVNTGDLPSKLGTSSGN